MDSGLLRGIPEFFETVPYESLSARTESLIQFRDLGPADLCLITKLNPKTLQKITSYHYVIGADVSSSASVAAYLNSLLYCATKGSIWKIIGGTYCSFNAVSRVDVRVAVNIPGKLFFYSRQR